jgi:hypothetical protein
MQNKYELSRVKGESFSTSVDVHKESPSAVDSEWKIFFITNFNRVISVLTQKPSIGAIGAIVFMLICTLLGIGVYLQYEVDVSSHKHNIFVGPSAELESSLRLITQQLVLKTKELAHFVTLHPECTELDSVFQNFGDIISTEESTIYVSPNYVNIYSYPSTLSYNSSMPAGVDNLAETPSIAKAHITYDGVFMHIPQYYSDSHYRMAAA